MMGMKKAAAGDWARERKEWAERRDRKEKTGKEVAGAAKPKDILENSCYSLFGVLEEQPEQSVLFCGLDESVFFSEL